jgi:iron complex transport system substrate-binding protein
MAKGIKNLLGKTGRGAGLILMAFFLGSGWSWTMGATFTDEVGRQWELPRPPQRIISLAPSITEILFALQLEKKIVGVSNFCQFPPAARNKAKIGDYAHPSLEKIVALKPDLVVGLAEGELKSLVVRLAELKIPVYISNPGNVAEIIDSIRRIGEVTSAAQKGLEIAAEMSKRIRQIREKVKSFPQPRVLHVLNFDPLLSAGKGTFIDDLIRLAGGRNLAETAVGKYPRLSIEEVLALDPEVILLASMKSADPLLEQRQWWERWKTITAVRQGRVYVLEADLIHRPSPRIVIGLEEVARALHPEAFKIH